MCTSLLSFTLCARSPQGRLGYIGEATTFPASHPLCPVITSFMAAVGILKVREAFL